MHYFRIKLINSLGDFVGDAQQVDELAKADMDIDDLREMLKKNLDYLMLPIGGVDHIFKGDCVKNCVISVQEFED